MSTWSPLYDAFWALLGTQLATHTPNRTQREDAFEWLIRTIAAPERDALRADIVHTLEDSILQFLGQIPEDHLGNDQVRQFVLRMLVPMMQGPLLGDMDATLRRLLGFVFRLPEDGRATVLYPLDNGAGQAVDVAVSEKEEEEAILNVLRDGAAMRSYTAVDFRLASVRTTIEKEVPELGQRLSLGIEVPIIRLLVSGMKEPNAALFDYMIGSFANVDPLLASHLQTLRESVLAETPNERARGLRHLCLAYLLSSYFELRRDLVRAVNKLRDAPVAEIDAICALPPLPEVISADTLARVIASHSPEVRSTFPDGAHYLFFLLSETALPEEFPATADIWVSYENAPPENKADTETVLMRWCEGIMYKLSPFEALGHFSVLLSVANVHAELQVPIDEQKALPLREWIQGYIHVLLSCGRDGTKVGRFDETFQRASVVERLRRQTHALCLQCGMWICGSPLHVREWEITTGDSDTIVGNWLVRGIVLAERLLPVLMGNSESTAEISAGVDRVRARLGFAIDAQAYPDLFNPFLFGPQGYDHCLAALLRLLDVTWDATRHNDTSGLPYWWSEPVHQALIALATQTETEAEIAWRSARDTGKMHRLKLAFELLPTEHARLLLDRYEAGHADS